MPSVYPAVYTPTYPAASYPPAPGGPTAAGWPPLMVAAALLPDQPVKPGVLILDDPVNGLLDTGRLADATLYTADITAYVRSISISRPSTRLQGPLLSYQPGTCSVTLDNSDGRFDPANLAGPYVTGGVSAIRPMIPVQVSAGGISLFSGYADGWAETPVTYSSGYAEIVLTASDPLAVLAGITIPPAAPAGAGELSGARVNRILNAAGWDTGRRRIAAGYATMQATTMGDTALNLLQLTSDSEIGELYADGSGSVVFRGSRAIITDPRSVAPQAVLGDQPGTAHPAGTELPYWQPGRADDLATLANDIQATRVGGTLQEVMNAASVAKYLFPRSYARTDLILQSDPAALTWAKSVLALSGGPEDRFDTLSVDPLADTATLFPQVTGRDFGDRIQVWRTPPGVGRISKDCFIRGIDHEIDCVNTTWLTTWTLQSAAPYTGFLVLDDPVMGVLGSNAVAPF